MNRQNLFETILRVTGFTPLESDMDEIQRAVMPEHNDMCLRNDSLLDKVKELESQLTELKQKHKRDVMTAYIAGDPQYNLIEEAEQYYKQNHENDQL